MKPLRGVGWVCALWALGSSAGPVDAAWCNVFQVCCASCGGGAAVSAGYAPAPAAASPCCPQPTCTTRYVQRCYYQPVTSYCTKTYYEPVTTYRTSYYYEPVTSYRYSCYYDPCSCSYQQVACPTTCYQLRSQCCPVQSWVQRCCQVPVTTYQAASYWEPVTTCCTPPPAPCCPTSYTPGCPAPAALAAPAAVPVPAVAAVPAPAVTATPGPPAANPAPSYAPPQAPAVTEQRTAPPGVQEFRGGSGSPLYDRTVPQPQQPPAIPPAEGSSYRQAFPRLPVRTPPPVPVQQPNVRLERIVSLPPSALQGRVLRTDNRPQSEAQVTFVSIHPNGPRQSVTADGAGQFRVTLASGGWLVYVNDAGGKPVFNSKIDVQGADNQLVTLVSR